MNSIILVGRLTKNPEIRYIGERGIPVAKFTLAVDRKSKKGSINKKTDFINIEAWQDAVDICAKMFLKGSLVSVTGTLRIDEYEDKQGNRRYMTKVYTSNVQLLQYNKNSFNRDDLFKEDNNIDLDKVALPF